MNFEQQFYNGLTKWQDEVETLYESTDGTPTSVLREDASKVREFYIGDGSYTRLEWPNQLTNFEDSTCTMNAAMCCWPKDRQGMSHVCGTLCNKCRVYAYDCSHHVFLLLLSFLISSYQPTTVMETVTIPTMRTVSTRMLPIIPIYALQTYHKARHRHTSLVMVLPYSPKTTMMARVQFTVMALLGQTMSMKQLVGTDLIIYSLLVCMITCTSVDM